MKTLRLTLVTMATLALWTTQGYAQNDSEKFYAGFSWGQFNYRETMTVPDASADLGISTFTLFEDNTHVSKVYGGYRITDRWSVEGGYVMTSALESTDSFSDPVLGGVNSLVNWDYEILSVRGLWTVRYLRLNLFMGGGLFDLSSSTDISQTSTCCGTQSLSDSDGESGVTIAFGLEWAFDAVTLRGELDVFFLESDLETDSVSVGLNWRF